RTGSADGFLHRPFHVGVRHQRKALAEMVPHRLHACDIGRKIRAAHLHLDGAEALGEIVVRLLQQALHREIKVDPAGITRYTGIEAPKQTKQRKVHAPRLEVPQRDVERGEREHRGSATPTIVQTPPDMMPDAFSVIGFVAFYQLRDFAPENIGDRAAIPADSVGVANALGTVGIADATSQELESLDFTMRAV